MDVFLKAIYVSSQSVFTTQEIALLIGEKNFFNLKSKLSYYVRSGKLIRLRRGVFVKDNGYNRNELAVRIYTPAYISLETILVREGVVFQSYETIFVASYLSREIMAAGNTIAYKRLKEEIITDRRGLIDREYYFEATKERAFLDRLYLSTKNYHFDNMRGIDWDACEDLLPVYRSSSLEKIFEEYRKQYV